MRTDSRTSDTGRLSRRRDGIVSSAAWCGVRRVIRATVAHAARNALRDAALVDDKGREVRWLGPEINRFIGSLEAEAERLRGHARLGELPKAGNRLMVELAIYTTAADRCLRRSNLAPESARRAVADIAWSVYRKMLALYSLPARLVSRNPARRLRWTIRWLLRFPFSPTGIPGYEAEIRYVNGNVLTHFTHCPPQTFVRRVSEDLGDPEALEAFRQSWCRFDWPGADIIAGDGKRGHYSRPRTLSHGDPVCDMCWSARPVEAETSDTSTSPVA